MERVDGGSIGGLEIVLEGGGEASGNMGSRMGRGIMGSVFGGEEVVWNENICS